MMKPLAIALAGAVTLGSVSLGAPGPAFAAPVSSNTLALKEALPDDVIQVHRRRGYHSGAAFAALAIGAISAYIAHKEYKRYRRHRYHHYGYYGYGHPHCIGYHGRLYCR